jgi:hypothetical protein
MASESAATGAVTPDLQAYRGNCQIATSIVPD